MSSFTDKLRAAGEEEEEEEAASLGERLRAAAEAPPLLEARGDFTGEVRAYGDREYGVFEYIDTPSTWQDFDWWSKLSYNAFMDVHSFLAPRNWAMATGAIAGTTAKGVMGGLGMELPPEGQWVDPSGQARSDSPETLLEWFNASMYNAPTFGEMGAAIVEPYTSWEKFGEYAYEHPVQLAIDASIVASGGRMLYRAGLSRSYAGARTTHLAASAEFNEALARGAGTAELETLVEAQRTAHTAVRGAAERLGRPDILRGAPTPEPGTILKFGQAPEISHGVVASMQRFFQRAPEQRWVDRLVDHFIPRSRGYTAAETAEMKVAMRGLTPETTGKFNSEFLALQQFPYNEARLQAAIAEGRILPQSGNALQAWNKILDAREARLIANDILTPEAQRGAAKVPAEVLGLASDVETRQLSTAVFREAAAARQATAETWGLAYEGPSRSWNILSVRDDLKLIAEQPELFMFDDAGRMVSPRYYPHQFAEDIAQGSVRALSEATLQHARLGEFKHRAGQLFARGAYNMDVQEALRRNIRRVNGHEGHTNIVLDTVKHWNMRSRHPNWKPGDPVPAGLVETYPDGFRVWVTTKFEEQVIELAKEAGSWGGLRAFEMRARDERLIATFFGESEKIIKAGEAALIPVEVANHIKHHMAPMLPAVEVLTDVGGLTTFWRHMVLSLRPAWQVVNETTNAMLTGIAGNIPGRRIARDIRARRPDLLQPMGRGTILPEFGETGGYAGATQQWLKERGKLGEFLINMNRRLSNTRLAQRAQYLASLNQARDDMYRVVNALGESKREFGRAAAGGYGLEVGGRTYASAEVAEIARSGELFLGAMETMLEGGAVRGNTAFLQEMMARGSEAVYSWAAMAPWQRQYLTKAIPFSGWQLFTTGLALRLPVKYPGRAWLLKTLGTIGQDYVDRMFEQVGIDPATVPDWDRTSIPLFVDPESGEVITFRANMFRLYDMFGVKDVVEYAFTHPAARGALELSGVGTFPDLAPLSAPPIEWGAPTGPVRNPFDTILESLFGSGYTLTEKLAHPYAQYGTGGLISPQPVVVEGERFTSGYDWRNALSQHFTGITTRRYESYDLMSRAHSKSYQALRGSFVTLENGLLDEYGQDHAAIRSNAELYLQRAYQFLDQIDAMSEVTDSERELTNLQREQTRYRNQIDRVEEMLRWMISHPGEQVPPEMIHGEGWTSPVEE